MEVAVVPGAALEVRFRPEYRCVNHARLLLNSFILLVTDDRTLAGRVAMTGAELIENAVKRATSPLALLRLKIDTSGRARAVRLETENEATPENARELIRVMDRVSQGTPMDAYTRALSAVPEQDVRAAHLGLARIRYEGRMNLACKVDGGSVRVMAETAD
jgi:hypothetical protein